MSMWLLRVFATAIRRRQILPIASVAGAQKAILRDAAAIAVCAEREAEQIGLDISPISRACVVPHISDFTSPMNVTTQLGLIVVPGRIEARKNQIAALRIAQHFPELTFLFVGALSPYEKRYVAEFLLTLGQTANARHVAALPKEEFYPVLSSAELVLNASFFEVTSLIDLYCIENSIPLVTTLHTYARASGAFRVFDPMSVGEGVRALRECLVQSRQDGRKITSAKENNSMSIVELIEGLL
ncbi:MAG: hypothetical protein GC186_19260 [Rhodobacteraceae bacterium]|nr:hypothetical protein [Paracoccaceae bacterium]